MKTLSQIQKLRAITKFINAVIDNAERFARAMSHDEFDELRGGAENLTKQEIALIEFADDIDCIDELDEFINAVFINSRSAIFITDHDIDVYQFIFDNRTKILTAMNAL